MPDPSSDIERWLSQAQAGSEAALGQMLGAARRYLLWIARREIDPDLQAKAGASDLVQDTLLEAYRDFAHFQGRSEAEWLAWLRRLLLNNLANFARSYRGTAKRRLERERYLDLDEERDIDQPDGRSARPSAYLRAQEEAEIIQQALARLPEDYQRVVTLWQQEDMTFEELGRQLGRSPNATRMLWVRALERLQRELTDR